MLGDADIQPTDPLDRPAEVRALGRTLDGPGPTLSLVTGTRGVGKSALIAAAATRATARGDALRYRASSLTDPDQRGLFGPRLEAWAAGDAGASPGTDPRSWTDLFAALADSVEAARRPCVLVMDDAHRLAASRGDWLVGLKGLWHRVRSHALPVHVVLAGDGTVLRDALRSTDPPLTDALDVDLELGPLPFRSVAALVPSWPAVDRLRCWAVFGGHPSRLRRIDPRVGLAANVRRLFLRRDAPFRLTEEEDLAVEVQTPARYASILRSMAAGRREWGDILEGSPAFDAGATMAPYLTRLESSGRIVAERSLDSTPRSRSRRYWIRDPFTAFWYRFVLPILTEVEMGEDDGGLWARRIAPELDRHAADLFPLLCREWVRRHGQERLNAPARESGGLWGAGYDLPVSGTLRNGAAFYGVAVWGGEPPGESLVDRLVVELGETRYGFGRETRHRIVFGTEAPTPGLVRRIARDPLVHFVGPGDLLGTA